MTDAGVRGPEPILPEAREAATSEILATIRAGHVRIPQRGDTPYFMESMALALLIAHEVVWCDAFSEEDDLPSGVRGGVLLSVNSSDVFAWGVSESEPLPYDAIESLYDHWLRDRCHGADVWCMIRRRQMPQGPVEERIRAAGVWNLDALRSEHGLRANHYDGASRARAQRQYAAYAAWARDAGRTVLPFDPRWWVGWREYEAAHPGWYDAAWKAADAEAIAAFRRENGYEERV